MPEINDMIRLLPVLKGIPAACLLALLLAGPLTVPALAHATGYRGERVHQALGTLEMLGLACPEGGAWRTTIGLPAGEPAPGEPGTAPGDTHAAPRGQDSRLDSLESKTLDQTLLDSLTESIPPGRVVAAIGALFGEPLIVPVGVEPDTQLLLGLAAEAYTMRHRLRKPARVCSANLRNNRRPGRQYLENPAAFLPADFLRQVGLPLDAKGRLERQARVTGYTWPVTPHADDLEDKPRVEDESPDPEAAPEAGAPEAGAHEAGAPESVPSPLTVAEQVWGKACEELQRSLPKASYDSYVRPLAALDYDAEARQLFLEAPSEPACAWLENRLKRILERLLVGVTGEDVKVVFLPPEKPDAGGEP